jgi:hypothetical protein
MGDRTDEEEERWARSNAKRMPIDPIYLERALKPLGFTLIRAARGQGSNDIRFLRPCAKHVGVFDVLDVKSGVEAVRTWADVAMTLSPDMSSVRVRVRLHVPATKLGYPSNRAPKTKREGTEYCDRLVNAIPALFEELSVADGAALVTSSATALAAVERYLTFLQVSDDLHETFQRLRRQTTDAQWDLTQKYLKFQTLDSLGLEKDWRIIWELTILCHVFLWERALENCLRMTRERPENADEIEVLRRISIMLSRLARQPGWPLHDPLVPNRPLQENEEVPWREGKPTMVAELFDEQLAANHPRCVCGRVFHYREHRLKANQNPPLALVNIRCNAGHEGQIELAWNAAVDT